MKTKILSKIMMIGFTTMMFEGFINKSFAQNHTNDKSVKSVTSNNNTTSKAMAPECNVCSPKDDHVIDIEKALRLIADFHNVVITTNSKINNAGGYFTEVIPTGIKQKNSLLTYPTFKIHWAVENIQNDLTRLFIMVDPADRVCRDNDQYSGTSGLESDEMMGTFAQNDIPLFATRGTKLTSTKILFELQENRRRIDPSYNHFRNIRNTNPQPGQTEAQILLSTFQNNPDVMHFYNCEDLVFEKALSIDQVSHYPNGQKSFFYLFGYDKEMSYHPLRLILAGYDAQNRIVFYDVTGTSLLRQNSRPRP